MNQFEDEFFFGRRLPLEIPTDVFLEDEDVHDGHRLRMRQKARRVGMEGMPVHEALEILLYCAFPRSDTNYIAHALLDTFGSVNGVLRAHEEELLQVSGMGKHAAEFICAFGEAVRTYGRMIANDKTRINTRADAENFAQELFRDEKRVQTWMVLLNHGGSVIFCSRLQAGVVWFNDETLEFIVKHALTYRAHYAVILANRGYDARGILHNDRVMVHDLAMAAARVGLSILDYIVVTPWRVVSLRRDVETGRSPFDFSPSGRSVQETWLNDPGASWEMAEDQEIVFPDDE